MNFSQSTPYKVVYLLHGLFGNHNTWIDYSMLADYTSKGKTIFIMPEVARSFYANMQYGFAYFDYISQELPQICQNMFNISNKPQDTRYRHYGLFNGGYGALKIALSYPQNYAFCGSFAGSCLLLEQGIKHMRSNLDSPELVAQLGQQLIDDFIAIFGANLTLKPEDNISGLINKLKPAQQHPKLFLTCGNEDAFYADNQAFIEILKQHNLNHKFQHWTGNHTYAFFNESLKCALDELNW